MTTLADHIGIASRYSRSANLERDAGAGDALDGYVLTGRVLEVLDRIVATIGTSAGGAWSVTGPYGSGKSSLGIYLDALLGPEDTETHTQASDALNAVEPELAKRLRLARETCGSSGFARGLVTAQQEPVTHSVTRALNEAVLSVFGKVPTAKQFPEIKLLNAANDDAASDDPRRTGPSPGSLLEVAVALSQKAPLLIVIDEFGKNLEAAQQRPDADLYLLQLLAEAAQSQRGSRIYLVTMQHLAFNEYASAVDSAQQREWAKIQGRFEDIAFVDTPSQTRRLISTVFTADKTLRPKIERWAKAQSAALTELQLFDLADENLIADCYPLHPVVTGVLPELCRRYGQNERTLFSFLSGSESTAVPAAMASRSADAELPVIELCDVYDYFVGTASSPNTSNTRWSEISLRLRDAAALSEDQMKAAKSVAVLNLIATNGPLRASRALLGSFDSVSQKELDDLEDGDLVVHRVSTDEYRIWQGTGVDIDNLVERISRELADVSTVELLNKTAELPTAVATGHTLRTDTLRTFSRSFVDRPEQLISLPPESLFDGSAYLSVNHTLQLPAKAPAGLPVVVQQPREIDRIVELAREVAALTQAVEKVQSQNDWVATSELRERLALARYQLQQCLDDANETSDWHLLTTEGPVALDPHANSSPLTQAADLCYPETPLIRNETLNRAEVSSQGAKARRHLLLAMLESEHLQNLGLEGYGPEVAMYNAVLGQTKMHRLDRRHSRFAVRPPAEGSLVPAWEIVLDRILGATDRRISIADIHAALRVPPIGMKQGPIPVLVTAVLIFTGDEVALYEHGTFRPVLTEEICDRMVRNPGHFEVKHYANASGKRAQIIAALAQHLDITPGHHKQRVSNVLAIVGELVTRLSALPRHTLTADNLSNSASEVRDAILNAVEPDELLFTALPKALGHEPVGPKTKPDDSADLFASELSAALEELAQHYPDTLSDLRNELFQQAREAGRKQLAAQAAIIEGEVLDPDLRSFVLALSADSFDDEHWIENLATVVTRAAPKLWTNDDRLRYRNEIAGKLAAFRRLLILHSELREFGSEGFDAQRITITSSTGAEDAVLVALDSNDREQIGPRAHALITELATIFGSPERAEKALLAWTAEQVLPNTVPTDNPLGSEPDVKAVNDD